MKKFKVNFTTKSGRPTHRYFRATNLAEAQAQFEAVTKVEVRNCVWTECPYNGLAFEDALYAEYLEKHPTRNVTFVAFAGDKIQ